MFKSGKFKTTQIGYINRNEQLNLGTLGIKGTDYGQNSYKLKCLSCKNEYGSNGTDIFERKCPACQRGRPGIPF
ncbi:MAG TPA: hypothetical protein C5S50_03745 [Methanosarcinaceae archaeon]|nr:hypothetical protein [Methanosarcinaceae archaeon]